MTRRLIRVGDRLLLRAMLIHDGPAYAAMALAAAAKDERKRMSQRGDRRSLTRAKLLRRMSRALRGLLSELREVEVREKERLPT